MFPGHINPTRKARFQHWEPASTCQQHPKDELGRGRKVFTQRAQFPKKAILGQETISRHPKETQPLPLLRQVLSMQPRVLPAKGIPWLTSGPHAQLHHFARKPTNLQGQLTGKQADLCHSQAGSGRNSARATGKPGRRRAFGHPK